MVILGMQVLLGVLPFIDERVVMAPTDISYGIQKYL